MTMAVTDALARGQQAVLCASTGNTSASAAAYAARAGITCAVLIPQGKIAMGKLAQAVMHGAKIIQIDGNFDDCLELARKMAADFPTIALVNSVNPVRIEGQKTAAFEIVDALGYAPDVHALPVGNAGNITAYWKGYTEYHRDGLIDKLPRMLGTQAAGAAPLVPGAAGEPSGDHRHRDPHRLAGVVDAGRRGAAAVQRTLPGRHRRGDPGRISPGGPVRRRLRRAGIGGQHRRSAQGRRGRLGASAGSTVVCTVTGNGLKDPDTALQDMPIVSPVAGRSRARRRASWGWSSGVACRAGGQFAVVSASSANLGPGFDSIGSGAESLRRNHRRDNRFRSGCRGRGRGRRRTVPLDRRPSGGARRRARAAGRWCQRGRPDGALPQRHSAFAWTRLVGGCRGGWSCSGQWSCRTNGFDAVERRPS